MKDFRCLDSITEDYIGRGYFPSAVISVFNEKETLYRRAYGENQMPDGSVQKVNTDTAYDMASCSKISTSTQILMLIDAGKLRLEDRIPNILTEIKQYHDLYSRLRSVTIYQLLTHTSGILDWYPFYTQCGRDFFEVFDSFIGSTEIVDSMVYSDMNFMLLGKVVERINGKPLEDCEKDFRDLLGAKRLQYRMDEETDPALSENIAPSCWGNSIEESMVAERHLTFDGWRKKDRPVIGCNDGNTHYFFHDVAGLAGVCSDADGYERLGRLYLNTESPLLKRSMTEQEPGRGLGWQIDERMYPQGAGHTGFTGTYIYVNPVKKIGMISLTNRLAYPEEHGTNTSEYRRAIAAALNEIL